MSEGLSALLQMIGFVALVVGLGKVICRGPKGNGCSAFRSLFP